MVNFIVCDLHLCENNSQVKRCPENPDRNVPVYKRTEASQISNYCPNTNHSTFCSNFQLCYQKKQTKNQK